MGDTVALLLGRGAEIDCGAEHVPARVVGEGGDADRHGFRRAKDLLRRHIDAVVDGRKLIGIQAQRLVVAGVPDRDRQGPERRPAGVGELEVHPPAGTDLEPLKGDVVGGDRRRGGRRGEDGDGSQVPGDRGVPAPHPAVFLAFRFIRVPNVPVPVGGIARIYLDDLTDQQRAHLLVDLSRTHAAICVHGHADQGDERGVRQDRGGREGRRRAEGGGGRQGVRQDDGHKCPGGLRLGDRHGLEHGRPRGLGVQGRHGSVGQHARHGARQGNDQQDHHQEKDGG